MKDPITVADVMNARMIAYPFTLLMCCLVTDGGGAVILTSAERAKDFPTKPVYVPGTGESVETPMVSQMEDFTSSKAFRVSGKKAFDEAGISHADVDHLMIYDAFAHLPLYGLEDLGFCGRGEAAKFIWERNTAPGGKLPLNTNGGGLSYMHSGMYGMYAIQESLRQLRGVAPAQVPGAKISVSHGVGEHVQEARLRHDHLVERSALVGEAHVVHGIVRATCPLPAYPGESRDPGRKRLQRRSPGQIGACRRRRTCRRRPGKHVSWLSPR